MRKYSYIAIAALVILMLAHQPSSAQGFIKKLENKIEKGSETLLKKKKPTGQNSGEKGEIQEKVEEKADEKKDDTKQGIISKGKMGVKSGVASVRQKVENERREYDQSNFNYAISFSDNSAFYETTSKLQRNRSMFMNLVVKDRSDYEKASALNLSGEMLYASGSVNQAQKKFEQAIELYKKIDSTNSLGYALSISNLGLLFQNSGRYTKAIEFNTEALAIRKVRKPGSLVHAASLNNMGVLQKDLGDYDKSEELIKQANQINLEKSEKSKVPNAITLNNLAMLYQTLGRYKDAEKLLNECLEVAAEEMREKSDNYIRFQINLAILYKETGRLDEAKLVYNRCMKIKRTRLSDRHPDYAHLCRGKAAVLMELREDDEEVVKLLTKAASIYEKKYGKYHPAYASTVLDLGNYYRVRNDYDQAKKNLDEAVMVRKELLGENHQDYLKAKESLGLLEWQHGNTAVASTHLKEVIVKTVGYIDTYFAPMSEAEKAKFWDKLQPRLQKFYSFAVENYTKDPELLHMMYNNQIKTKALLLNSTSKVRNSILNSGSSELIVKYTMWLNQKEELARVYTLTKKQIEEENINLDSLEKATNALEKKLIEESVMFNSSIQGEEISYKSLHKLLEDDEALVEIVQFRRFNVSFTDEVYYAGLIMTKEISEPKLVLLKNGADMEAGHIRSYRKAMTNYKDDPTAYTNYWEAFDKVVGKKKKVYVSLDGVYNVVSLNTLKDGDTYLIDRHDFVLLSNAKDLNAVKNIRPAASRKTATLIGFPDYGNNKAVDPLPGTKTEVEFINGLLKKNKFKTTVFLGGNASEGNVKSSETKILHIATHGFFFPDVDHVKSERVFGIETSKAKSNPLHRSGLLLANAEATIFGQEADHSTSNNGILTAYETMNLSLEETELVVLSACETGLGDIKAGEGVYGLQRSFQVAGAKSVIMSLWWVSDEATMELMRHFYQQYMKTGNKQASFLAAQQAVKLKFKEPYFWGAFVLIGS